MLLTLLGCAKTRLVPSFLALEAIRSLTAMRVWQFGRCTYRYQKLRYIPISPNLYFSASRFFSYLIPVIPIYLLVDLPNYCQRLSDQLSE
ncbi:hypothetical protein K432DRAFT_99968 [Lepidopterella palustris CBS 459.81]|uniref:Uncharacterized protein n=1 Tax=Lepidopterella palustris CBS 459.81 TaxID=1314670 RepID=A0A8E2E690_9PEZI|nr:hypothetical protein K432DRAFT_99968 [Lepidopterella palustris CBS 459.81]